MKFSFVTQVICITENTHYGDVIMGAMASQITGVSMFAQPFFGCRSKKTSKPCDTGLCEGNSPVTGEFPSQKASNAENVSIWWRHHGKPVRAGYFEKRNLCINQNVILTHHPRNKMAAFSQTIFSGAFSWMKNCVILLKFHWSLFLTAWLTISQHWFR